MNPVFSRRDYGKSLVFVLSLLAVGYLLYHTLAGGTLLTQNVYDSYALQAQNWLHGRIDIENGASYTWLELAIYQGRYYLSFPPLPSLCSLPFVWLFGSSPSNLLIALWAMGGFVCVFGCFHAKGYPPHLCAFWGFFFTYATNLAEFSRSGGVWFQAQALHFFLCMGALWALCAGRRNLCLALFALAVGCRPFAAVYLLAAGVYFLWQGKREGARFWQTVRGLCPGILAVLAVAGAMMAYNQARFGNPLEFGHNYLPEFTQSQYGQFHFSYFLPNLLQLFRLPSLTPSLAVEFPLFNGFLFFAVNPVFIVWAVRLFRQRRAENGRLALVFSLGSFLAVLAALCLHKTMGGWQFGARYTVDLLPACLLGLCLVRQPPPSQWERWLCAFGGMVNVFGAVYMLLQEMG